MRFARARELLDLKVHKQELNRLLEPFLWHTVVVTATEWQNFFELRCATNAQPEIRAAAMRMREAIDASRPAGLDARRVAYAAAPGRTSARLDAETRKRISAARCARVSYLTHEGSARSRKISSSTSV